MNRVIRLTVAHVEHIAFELARNKLLFDEPIPDFHTRYPQRLESCLETPFQTFEGRELYRTDWDKVSILFYLMNKNHPFQNGNKRIAMTTMLYALWAEGKWLNVHMEELYQFAVWISASPRDSKDEMVAYIKKFLKKYTIPMK